MWDDEGREVYGRGASLWEPKCRFEACTDLQTLPMNIVCELSHALLRRLPTLCRIPDVPFYAEVVLKITDKSVREILAARKIQTIRERDVRRLHVEKRVDVTRAGNGTFALPAAPFSRRPNAALARPLAKRAGNLVTASSFRMNRPSRLTGARIWP
ncbi:hypothetical protein K0M31_013406 [Melipona bicolor]|uniref:Uncharacterized protein n=1 Tax=Melipona bicolor TaxID=60889 RepID=A0AA40FIN9_9HYME|nr:hypothetical protein K0M31_013406 [Melipona bicolor]